MKNTITTICLCFLSQFLFPQNSIQSKVLDDREQPMPFVSVILNNAVDSSIVKVEYTNDDGTFLISNINDGNYWITLNYVGLQDFNTDPFSLSKGETKKFDNLQFSASNNTLEEVTVTAKRPLLELKADKVVMNVAGSINSAGEDALSLLKKSPGVVVDNNDNITMLGKSGVQIYIDGKPSPLSGNDLAAYLRSLNSDQIDAMEIITNPSAKYDAEGSAGIINIKLIKDKNLGTNGNVSLNFGQGEFSRYGLSFNGNYRTKRWYAFTSLGAWHGKNFNNNDLYRIQSGYLFDQRNRGEGEWNNYSTKIGLDHFINEKNTVGVILNYSPGNNGNWDNGGTTRISQFGAGVVDSFLVADNKSDWESSDWSANLNYQYTGNSDRSLNVDLDYAKYNTQSLDYQPNVYLGSDSISILSERNFFMETPKEISIASIKIDYEQKILDGMLGLGVKYSDVLTDNVFNFNNVIDNQNIIDIERSNQFEYKEAVAAGYATYSRKLGSVNMQVGLRMEQTRSTGTLTAMVETNNEKVKRSYLNFFPNLGFSYQLNEKNSFNASYSRRLNRPSYQDMNPFTSRLDELTFEKGNPFLNPEYANNFQLSHSWNYKINTSIGFTHTKDQITRILDKASEKSTFITWLNLEDQKSYSINVSSPMPIKEWWNTYTSITGVYTQNSAQFDDGKFIDLSAKSVNIYSQHSFTLPKGISMEVSGWYSSPSIWGGNIEMEEMYSVDFGIQKKFMNNNLNVKLSISDVFNTQNWRGKSIYGDLNMTVSGRGDNQRAKIALKYNFGNDQLKSRQRKTGLEDEKGRIKGEG